jgi:16S rRNA (guanine527-N7)-methyltransferase
MDACHEKLTAGLAALNLAVDEQKVWQLLAFISLIEKWNKAYNLTAIKTKQDMVSLHLLDSLTVLPYLQGRRIIDIGTGAGLPGIPLAICLPELSFTLLDSNAKKTRFVQQAVLELKLTNVEIYQSRVEDFRPAELFDTVISRAFADMEVIVELTRHLLENGGLLLAMKGHCLEPELAKILASPAVIPVRIPGVDAERNLVLITS